MTKDLRNKLLDKLESVQGMNPKAGMTYALRHFSEFIKIGIGISRREITQGTRELSPFVHSWNTFRRYTAACAYFVSFCRNDGINKLHKLHYDTVEGFLTRKIEKERTNNTIETDMCALKKFFVVCERRDLHDRLDNDYGRFKYAAKLGRTIHAFDNPDHLIRKVFERDELSGIVASLQRATGARIHEVRPLEIVGITIVIRRGKGGRSRVLDFSFRLKELGEIEGLMAGFRGVSKDVNWQEYCQEEDSTYQRHVKAACKSIGDEYVGAHGFRAVYAQELDRKLKERGLPVVERERIITRDLGHNRRSMARHYLSA